MKTSLQLWSIKEEVEKDFSQTLEIVSEMGYEGVEFAGYFNHSAKEIIQLLTDYRLEVSGSHIPLEMLRDNLEGTLDFEKEIGNKQIIIPWLKCDSIAAWMETFQELDELAAILKKAGFQLSYHNHGHEFLDFPNTDILDLMYHTTHNIFFEIDVYWLAYANIDVLAWLKDHKDKILCLHFKDLCINTNGEKESCELGKGKLPLKDYLNFSKEEKISFAVVEQEAFTNTTPLNAAKNNVLYLKKENE